MCADALLDTPSAIIRAAHVVYAWALPKMTSHIFSPWRALGPRGLRFASAPLVAGARVACAFSVAYFPVAFLLTFFVPCSSPLPPSPSPPHASLPPARAGNPSSRRRGPISTRPTPSSACTGRRAPRSGSPTSHSSRHRPRALRRPLFARAKLPPVAGPPAPRTPPTARCANPLIAAALGEDGRRAGSRKKGEESAALYIVWACPTWLIVLPSHLVGSAWYSGAAPRRHGCHPS